VCGGTYLRRRDVMILITANLAEDEGSYPDWERATPTASNC
jgi:hypothetical protein